MTSHLAGTETTAEREHNVTRELLGNSGERHARRWYR